MFIVRLLNSDLLLCFFLLFVILDTSQCVCNVTWYLTARRVSLPLYSTVEINISLIGCLIIQSDTKKWELLKNPTKIEEIQEKKFMDRN